MRPIKAGVCGLHMAERANEKISAIEAILDRLVLVEDPQQESRLLDRLADPEGPRIVSFVNAHAVNVAWKDPGFRKHLVNSDFLLRDGSGIRLCLVALRRRPGVNLNGTDLIPKIIARYAGRRVALFGTKEPNLSEAGARLVSDHRTEVVSKLDGSLPARDYLEASLRHQPDLIVLAMGMPKQERVAYLLKQNLRRRCVIVNGGAILDFVSGRLVRAPLIMRRLGLEWVWRLLTEPGRLWRRYLIGNPSFLAKVALMAARRMNS
jgi:exopolysaccharide biosynthesis WecB/TagA/CpsF family protein